MKNKIIPAHLSPILQCESQRCGDRLDLDVTKGQEEEKNHTKGERKKEMARGWVSFLPHFHDFLRGYRNYSRLDNRAEHVPLLP